MDYFTFNNQGELIGFDAVRFLKDVERNRKILRNLEIRRAELEGFGVKAIQYDKVKVQSSGISDPTAELAVTAQHLESQIALYYFWISSYEDAMRMMDSESRWLIECMFSGRRGAYKHAMEHFCVEQTTIYRMRKDALAQFTNLMVGHISSP